MKQAVNFRLSAQTIHTLYLLEEKMHATKTAIIEVALQAYAKQKLHPHNGLLSFAGMLDNDEANNMLKNIKKSRRNKNKDIFL
jgi:predicted transcriptional regulator